LLDVTHRIWNLVVDTTTSPPTFTPKNGNVYCQANTPDTGSPTSDGLFKNHTIQGTPPMARAMAAVSLIDGR
jgi:hypothetical protein